MNQEFADPLVLPTQAWRRPAVADALARDRVALELRKLRRRMAAVILTCALATLSATLSFADGHLLAALCFLVTAGTIASYFFLGPGWTHRPRRRLGSDPSAWDLNVQDQTPESHP